MTFSLFPKNLFSCDQKGIQKLASTLKRNVVSSTLTNLGVLNQDNYSFTNNMKGLQFVVGPSRDQIMCTSMITYNNNLVINIVYNTGMIPCERINDISERFLSRLLLVSKTI